MLGFCVRFAHFDVLSRVPAFRPIRTQWAASQAEGVAVTREEQSQLLHSSVPAFVLASGTCCPPFFKRKAYANDGSSTSPTEEISHALTDSLQSASKALYFSRICARSFDASLEGSSRGRAVLPAPPVALASSSPRCPPSKFSRYTTHTHEGWTELFVSRCAFCLGSVLHGARCFVIKPTCLCHCLCHGLRARDKISFERRWRSIPSALPR